MVIVISNAACVMCRFGKKWKLQIRTLRCVKSEQRLVVCGGKWATWTSSSTMMILQLTRYYSVMWVCVWVCGRRLADSVSVHTDYSSVSDTRMWANAQRDGRPAEYRWCPLFNATKFGWRPLLECRAVTLPTKTQNRWNLQGCPKLANRSQPVVP